MMFQNERVTEQYQAATGYYFDYLLSCNFKSCWKAFNIKDLTLAKNRNQMDMFTWLGFDWRDKKVIMTQ